MFEIDSEIGELSKTGAKNRISPHTSSDSQPLTETKTGADSIKNVSKNQNESGARKVVFGTVSDSGDLSKQKTFRTNTTAVRTYSRAQTGFGRPKPVFGGTNHYSGAASSRFWTRAQIGNERPQTVSGADTDSCVKRISFGTNPESSDKQIESGQPQPVPETETDSDEESNIGFETRPQIGNGRPPPIFRSNSGKGNIVFGTRPQIGVERSQSVSGNVSGLENRVKSDSLGQMTRLEKFGGQKMNSPEKKTTLEGLLLFCFVLI